MARRLEVAIVGDASSLARAFGAASVAADGFAGRMASVGGGMQRTGRTMVRGITLPLVAAGVASVKMASDFEGSMSKIRGLVGASEAQVEDWGKQILQLGPRVGKGPRELADAMYFITSAGITGKRAIEALTISARASSAGLGETKVIADALTSAMNAYAKSGLTAAEAGDVLVAAVREGKMEADQLAEVMGDLVPTGSALGISFAELAGTLAVLSKTGTNASEGATQLSAVMSSMLSTSPKVVKALGSVGLSQDKLRKVAAGPGGLVAAMRLVDKAFGGNLEAMRQVFPNVRAFRAVMNALAQEGKGVDKVLRGVRNATGALDKAFKEAQKTSGFKFAQLRAQAETAGIALGMVLLPAVTKVTDWLQRLALAWSNLSPRTQRYITLALAIAAATGPVVLIMGKLVSAVAALVPVVAALVSPVGLVVLGVVALAAALTAAVLWPEKFSAALQRMGLSAEQASSVVGTLRSVVDAIRQVVEQGAAFLQAVWARYGDLIVSQTRAAWQYISGTIRNALLVIRGIVNIIGGLLQGDWSRVWLGIQQVFGGIVGQLLNTFRYFGTTLVNALQALGRTMLAYWQMQWRLMVAAVTAAWRLVVGAITGAIGAALAAAEAVGAGILRGLDRGLVGLVNTVRRWFQRLWDWIEGAADSAYAFALNVGKAIPRGIWDGISGAAGWLWGKVEGFLSSLKDRLTFWSSPPEAWAEAVIGRKVVEGIARGILASMGEAADAAEQAVRAVQARMQATQVVAAVQAAGRTIGLEHALAVARGVLAGAPTIVGQVRQALAQATAAARQQLVDMRGAFADAFGTMAQSALAAFDAKVARWVPPAQRLLERMQLQDQAGAAKQAITDALKGVGDAQKALEDFDTAVASGAGAQLGQLEHQAQAAKVALENLRATGVATKEALAAASLASQQAQAAVGTFKLEHPDVTALAPEDAVAQRQQLLDAVVQAERQLGAAKRAQVELNLQLEAQQQQAAHDARVGKQREQLAKQLLALQGELAKHPGAWRGMSERVVRLLRSYHVPMYEAGARFASRFADGLRDNIAAVEAAGKALAEALAKYIPRSPAKAGPLRFDPYTAGRRWAGDYASGLHAGAAGMGRGALALAGATAGGGAGGRVYNVTLTGPVAQPLDEQVLATVLRRVEALHG